MNKPTLSGDERYSICKGCEFYNELLRSCKKCGCFLPAKTKLKNSNCPIGKW